MQQARQWCGRWAGRAGRLWQPVATVVLAMVPSLVLAADPQIAALVDNPDPVPAGGLYTYTLRLDNNAVDAATNARLTFTVPSGAAYVSASPAGANCVALNPTTVRCSLGTLGALGADVRTIVLSWRATVPGPAVVNASAVVSADNDVNAANNAQNATTTVVEGADLGLTKTGSPNPATAGGQVSYVLTASNLGPNVGGPMVLTDNLPPSVGFVSAQGAGWSCSHTAGVVRCTQPGPLAVGAAAAPVTIVGKVNAAGGAVTNSATVAPAAGGVADPINSNNTATADTAILPGADLRIAQKSVVVPAGGAPATAGAQVSFLIQPRNDGPSVAVNAVVTDALPAGWTFVSAAGPNWACAAIGQTVRCTRASLGVGATDDITVVATAPANAAVAEGGSTSTNTAGITSDVADPVPTNNTGAVDVLVRRDGADLRLTKTKTPNPVALGANMVSTIVVTNGGPRAATGPLRVVELLNGESFISASGAGWVCTPNANLVVCAHPNAGGLAVGASLPTLQITTQATVAGAASNTACTGSSVPPGAGAVAALPPLEGDPNTANDCASVTASSTAIRPDLQISKTTSTPLGGDKTVGDSESSVTYTLDVANISAGTDAATGVRISDPVPAFIAGRTTFGAITAVVSAGNAAFACSASAAGVVTCNQTAGALAPGQAVRVAITVNRPLADGVFTNTATVTNTVEGDPNRANNSASDTVTIAPIADVQMSGKQVLPAAVRAGESATYALEFRNNGPSLAQGVVVTDTFNLPPGDTGFTVVSVASSKAGAVCSLAAGAQITLATPAFNCSIGSLANSEVGTITLVVRPNFLPGNAVRSLPNTARITTTSREAPDGGDNGNNSQGAALDVNPAALNLLVNKTDVVDPVPFYSAATFMDYRVTASNAGPSFGTAVKISEAMVPPAGKRVRFVCDTIAAGSATCNPTPLCNVANVSAGPGMALPTFSCDLPPGTAATGPGRGELASGQSKTVFLRFEALDQPEPNGDVFNNTATVSANEPDTSTGNDSESEGTTTRQRIDLRVAKTSSAPNVALNEPFTWTITVENRGPGNSLRTDLADTLPAGVEVLAPGARFTRSLPALAGVSACTVVGSMLNCALGQLDANGVATITVPVRFASFPAGGTGTNSATVDTDPAKTGGLDTPGGNNTGTSTVAVNRASLAGTVYLDRDRTAGNGGTRQPGTEPGIVGVAIRLTGTDAFGNAVNLSTSTDASGNYSFASLPPSGVAGYVVTETQPAGHINSPSSPPAAGAAAASAGGIYAMGGNAGDSSYSAVVLAASTVAQRYDFPEVRLPSLSGFVYVDANLSGSREAGADAPIANATVRLRDATTGDVLAETLTDATGAYRFSNLDPLRSYTLEQPLPISPSGLGNGPVNPGLVNGLACAAGCTVQPNSPAAGTDRITAIALTAGDDGTLFNFGERQLASVSGLVYVDGNRSNTLDATDTGRLPGVTVNLVRGADCATGTLLQTTTTAADGSWRFDNVVALQPYLVCEVQPAGYGTGNANGTAVTNQISIASLATNGSAGNAFGDTLASLSGTVYQDNGTGVPARADNGLKDPGEVGLEGVPITLTGVDVNGLAVTRTVVTDVNGNWVFDGLVAANGAGYTVTEGVIPAAAGRFIDGRETLGALGGSAAVNDQFASINLAAGAVGTGYLFGELGIAPISGTVYIDLNTNGTLQDPPADGRIPGVVLTLVQGASCAGPVLATRRTDADGNYSFSGSVVDLDYTVCEAQPSGYLDGGTNPGVNGSSNAANSISITRLPALGSFGNHFGEIANNGVISGRVWLDANNNGSIDPGETGLAGVPVELAGTDLAGNAVLRPATTTDADGNYRFDNLPPGTYTLREPNQPAGTLDGRTVPGTGGGTGGAPAAAASSISGIQLGLAQTASGNNFGELPPAVVAGVVYADNNNNGRIDGTETGLGGVAITLTGTDDLGAAVNTTINTQPDGSYSLGNLRPGNYTVTQPTQPPGTVNGITSAGSLGGTTTTPADAVSAIRGIVLPVGGQALANNFGELGASPDLRVGKSHSPAVFTANNRGNYSIHVRNAGDLPTVGSYTVNDRLPGGVLLSATPTGVGWVCSGAPGASSFACTSSVVLAAGASAALIDAPVAIGDLRGVGNAQPRVDNAVLVEGGGEIAARAPSDDERGVFNSTPSALPLCDEPPQHNACRDPAPVQSAAAISGTVWFDTGTSARLIDAGDKRLAGWLVEVVQASTGSVVGTATTDANGQYTVERLLPGIELLVRFRDPASRVLWGSPVNGDTAAGSGVACDNASALLSGRASSCLVGGASPGLQVVLASGQTLPQQSLPVDPTGVVYDSGSRAPVPGAVVAVQPVGACTGWDPASQLLGGADGGYQISGASARMTVGADGLYQFTLAPGAPPACDFAITVTPPEAYVAPSALIPPTAGTLLPNGGAGAQFKVQPQVAAPTGAVGPATGYWLLVRAGSTLPVIVHNHIPLDPALPAGISLQKTGDRAVAEVGDTVRYSITVQTTGGPRPRQTTVVDRLPAGFTYVPGTAMVGGATVADPIGGPGPVLAFNLGAMPATNRLLLHYRVRVGVGAQQGDGVNRARAYACGVPAGCVGPDGRTPIAGSVATNEGQHRVQVSGGVFATEACVLGKVFVDCNGNHVQDREELGIPGVRLVLSDSSNLISDSEGKYSLCGLPPRSHVLRIDPHTLPRGSRLTTSSNRNLGDAGSLWLDLKNGELHRADFIEGSCSNTVLDQVKARRAQGEVRAPETERAGQPALRFDSKAHGLDALSTPQQGTDSANQQAPKARQSLAPGNSPPARGAADPSEQTLPTPALPMNRPPPAGRTTNQAPDADNGGRDATR